MVVDENLYIYKMMVILSLYIRIYKQQTEYHTMK